MIDDFAPPARKKPKTIMPLEKPARKPLPVLDEATEPGFTTPEETAASEPWTITEPSPHPTDTDGGQQKGPSDKPNRFWHTWHWPLDRKWTIIASVIALLVIGGGVAAAIAFWPHPAHHLAAKATPKVVPVVKAPILSTLTGLPVADASVNQRPVTGVMIENSVDARPQSGLGQAGVVFEAVAEGGVTRFLALYQDTQPDNVGPVRSARPYYIQWALGFDAAYAHVGGSPDGLQDIKDWGVKDLDQFANGGSYHRISTRYAPHNVYTSIATLNQLETSKGFTSSTYTGFIRKKEQPYKAPAAAPATKTNTVKPKTPADTRTPAKSIDMSLSGPVYNPHYDYNAATNSYNRSEGGAVHTDANNNAQLSPKVVIAMVMSKSQGALDSSGAYYTNYNVVGSGPVYIFQDGVVTTGNWTKTAMNSQITFTDAAGQTIPLNPGQTWLTAVDSASAVTSS